ncbi:MAG: 50S ribosomal protein L30 [Nitrospirae bacterium]|nr:50S ribosomal protein L30 [Candidatus Manganitrophaceae bacterium]
MPRTGKPKSTDKQLSIKLVRSFIGRPGKHKKVVAGLGLRKMNQTVIRVDTPQTRGMVAKIAHLLEVKELS